MPNTNSAKAVLPCNFNLSSISLKAPALSDTSSDIINPRLSACLFRVSSSSDDLFIICPNSIPALPNISNCKAFLCVKFGILWSASIVSRNNCFWLLSVPSVFLTSTPNCLNASLPASAWLTSPRIPVSKLSSVVPLIVAQ